MRICVCACVCVCGCAPHLAEVSKIVQDATRAGTQRPEPPDTPTEHKTTGKAEKPAYIGINAGNEKKSKKVKKNLEIAKKAVPLQHKPKTTKQYDT